jgi:hypothetical protein
MSVNLTAWLFIPAAEPVWCDYLRALLPQDLHIEPALTATQIITPHIAVRNTVVRPFTAAAGIVAHVETVTTITIRSAMDEEMRDTGRTNHNTLVAAVMGCLMVADETTGENALPAELNAVGSDDVEFSMAAWSAMTSGGDDENRHFVTRIEMDTIIHPKQQPEPEE